MSTWAILLAAGSGQRMGAKKNKVLLRLGGIPVVLRSLRAMEQAGVFHGVIVATKEEEWTQMQDLLRGAALPCRFVPGGATRQKSVENALLALPEEAQIVAIHDAARCLVSPQLFRDCVAFAREYGSGVAGRRVYDTVKRVEDGEMIETLDREALILVETPQAFSVPLIKEAYARAKRENIAATDDAMLVERMGVRPKLVLSEQVNVKMTQKHDLAYAEHLLGARYAHRVGQGFDVHVLVDGRKLVLGGVEIDCEKGLLGHSDADVLVHAVMDALLGAAGLADIGAYFPDTDPQYAGIRSMELLKRVGALLEQQHVLIENIDATVILQQPKLAPYREQMRQNIAQALGVDPRCVGVKATTTEHLGFVGRGEGAAAQAVCMVKKLIKP